MNTRYDYTYGTAHFSHIGAIRDTYKCTTECAQDMLHEGLVHIGPPSVKQDEKIVLRTNGRYYIEVWVPTV